MVKFCPKCGSENLDESLFCRNCGYDFKKINEDLMENSSETEEKIESSHSDKTKNLFNWKNILIAILILIIILFAAPSLLGNSDESSSYDYSSSDSASGIDYSNGNDSDLSGTDIDDSDIKSHEFNYANRISFNISDELTDKTGVKNLMLGEGVSYKYSDGDVCHLGALIDYGSSDEIEYRQNDAFYKEIDTNPTQQGFKAYIFNVSGYNYEVFIDLDSMTFVENDFPSNYSYFDGDFKTYSEAKTFVNTFKVNESSVKQK